MPYRYGTARYGRAGYVRAAAVLFEDKFKRGPATDWGARWNNYDAVLGDWTIDASNYAVIRCEATGGNHGYNIVQKAGGGMLTIPPGRAFYLEAGFKTTDVSFFGAGGLVIFDGATFGYELGVQKGGGTNSVYASKPWMTGPFSLPTNFTDKTMRLELNKLGTIMTVKINGAIAGTFNAVGLASPYSIGMFFLNQGAGNQMKTYWEFVRAGYL